METRGSIGITTKCYNR